MILSACSLRWSAELSDPFRDEAVEIHTFSSGRGCPDNGAISENGLHRDDEPHQNRQTNWKKKHLSESQGSSYA